MMSQRIHVQSASLKGSRAVLKVEGIAAAEYQTRVNGGFWSTWRPAGIDGLLEVNHPRLLLNAEHQIEVRMRDPRAPQALSEISSARVRAPAN